MRFHADHYFQIGRAHYSAGLPCQDFATSESNGARALAVVSDGCSTGGQTDIGARLVALSTLAAIRQNWADVSNIVTDVSNIVARQKTLIAKYRDDLGLTRSDMLATCASIHANVFGAKINVQGDGVAAIVYRSGLISAFRFDWTGNAPLYPSYDQEDRDAYIKTIMGGDHYADALTIQKHLFYKDCWHHDRDVHVDLGDALDGYTIDVGSGTLSEISAIAVFSDGVTQIDEVDWRCATRDFVAYKSTAGEFAKRRMIRGIADYSRLGLGPSDDISCAVVRIDHSEEEKDVR